MLSIKQTKATKRNFFIMYLTGVIHTLNRLDSWVDDLALKGTINVVRCHTEYLRILLKETNYEKTFHATQTDVKYECKKSNQ